MQGLPITGRVGENGGLMCLVATESPEQNQAAAGVQGALTTAWLSGDGSGDLDFRQSCNIASHCCSRACRRF